MARKPHGHEIMKYEEASPPHGKLKEGISVSAASSSQLRGEKKYAVGRKGREIHCNLTFRELRDW